MFGKFEEEVWHGCGRSGRGTQRSKFTGPPLRPQAVWLETEEKNDTKQTPSDSLASLIEVLSDIVPVKAHPGEVATMLHNAGSKASERLERKVDPEKLLKRKKKMETTTRMGPFCGMSMRCGWSRSSVSRMAARPRLRRGYFTGSRRTYEGNACLIRHPWRNGLIGVEAGWMEMDIGTSSQAEG